MKKGWIIAACATVALLVVLGVAMRLTRKDSATTTSATSDFYETFNGSTTLPIDWLDGQEH